MRGMSCAGNGARHTGAVLLNNMADNAAAAALVHAFSTADGVM
jgi:hypothetical protein